MAFKRPATLAHIDPNGARDATWADAQMAIETPVFGGNHGIGQMRAHRIGVDHPAKLLTAPGKDIAVAVQHRDRTPRAGIDHLTHIGQKCIIVGRGAQNDQGDHSGNAPNNPEDQAQHKP